MAGFEEIEPGQYMLSLPPEETELPALPPPTPNLWGRFRSKARGLAGFWRTVEFGLSLAAAIAAYSVGGDMTLVIPALIFAWIVAFLGLASSTLNTSRVIGWALTALVLFAAEGLFLYFHFARTTYSPVNSVLSETNTTISVPADINNRSFHVFNGFQLTADVLNRLGKPQDNAQPTLIYKAKYERATVFWIAADLRFYFLPDQSDSWDSLPETTTAPNTNYWDEKWLDGKFKNRPPGLLPPSSGIAVWWLEDPKKWISKTGWRLWSCNVDNGFRQTFENGVVFGPVFNTPFIHGDGITMIIYNDKTWDHRNISGDAPQINDCIRP